MSEQHVLSLSRCGTNSKEQVNISGNIPISLVPSVKMLWVCTAHAPEFLSGTGLFHFPLCVL